ncbi:ComGG family competence protein [Salipaludibacillus sp. LMS25]|jgi:competence protein ComGC|uniref:competence type IV pilus minor pilin ComGG n=1 Tax=Salipaludibacillus sp. LMS25 TaxID=2924031 RepID=UPI0020D04BB9|nr:competence type IV pilus minor pilin ComGG [Salipaludibacillus sp. LMS25]UTR14459.1 ComGG family competence protein [Salipaludibacillus sp. LMS25]
MNEKGFTLMLMLMILMCLSLVTITLLNLYEHEMAFAVLEQEWATLDQLLITATAEIVQMIEEESELVLKSVLDYKEGKVMFEVEPAGRHYNVFLTSETSSSYEKKVSFIYNIGTGKIESWQE